MPILKKRNWKTVDLGESEMADFAAMGGLEIDVLSDDSDVLKELASKSCPEKGSEKSKPKKKKQKKVAKAPETEQTTIVPLDTPTGADIDMSAWLAVSAHLDVAIMSGLTRLGFTRPSPIQAAVVDKALEGQDILAAAQTGSGKTLAFGLPILQSILASKPCEAATRALCILPTRELALQVKTHMEAVTGSSISIGAAVGGMSMDKQFRVLSKRPDIIVGTPGRVASLLGLSKTQESAHVCADLKEHLCDRLSFLVLDEADRLLEKAHFRDLTSVLRFLYQAIPAASTLQSFIFSATLPVEGAELSQLLRRLRLQSNRFVVDLVRDSKESTLAPVPRELSFKTLYASEEDDREPTLLFYLMRQLLDRESDTKVIVFVNAISYVYRLASLLPLCLPAVKVVGIHSNLRQKDRLKKLDQFKAASATVMIATDLAARGLDLPSVKAVVHLQPPRTPEALIHRSGRTARAGREGECAMIVTPKMAVQWNRTIKQALGINADEVESITPVSTDLNRVREIHRLANKIEGESHRTRRDSKEKAWTKKTCQEADLWDSDALSDSEGYESDVVLADGGAVGVKRIAETVNANQQALNELLRNPLPSLIRN